MKGNLVFDVYEKLFFFSFPDIVFHLDVMAAPQDSFDNLKPLAVEDMSKAAFSHWVL